VQCSVVQCLVLCSAARRREGAVPTLRLSRHAKLVATMMLRDGWFGDASIDIKSTSRLFGRGAARSGLWTARRDWMVGTGQRPRAWLATGVLRQEGPPAAARGTIAPPVVPSVSLAHNCSEALSPLALDCRPIFVTRPPVPSKACRLRIQSRADGENLGGPAADSLTLPDLGLEEVYSRTPNQRPAGGGGRQHSPFQPCSVV
jgi:hypothetical protein